jgi:hypothetical protein
MEPEGDMVDIQRWLRLADLALSTKGKRREDEIDGAPRKAA